MIELTKGEIREAAIKYFTAIGFNCWRQNNTSPTRRRTFIGRYGVSDIIGFRVYDGSLDHPGYCGEFFACEVKTKNDRLSDAQKQFLLEVNSAGGFGYLAEDNGDGTVNYRLYTGK